MTQTQIVTLLVAVAIFFFAIGIHAFPGLVKSYRAQTWITTISMCACFWSFVAAVIVGIS